MVRRSLEGEITVTETPFYASCRHSKIGPWRAWYAAVYPAGHPAYSFTAPVSPET
jgi:hypothetical protein